MIRGKVLITGGSGTLGHAIVRTALEQGWEAQFTIYSRSEFLQAQMKALYPQCNYVLGDVANYDRLAAAISGHDMVIHAAAMKRIPECELQAEQCYTTNVVGAMNVVKACKAHQVHRCIGISTDKACRAITAYGASKLAMEKLFQSQDPERYPIFTLVRYGNVVASRGSVIPLWKRQAAQNMPLSITDPRATRFWMSESDAVELIQYGSALDPGVIIVPKMQALSISEMARIIAPEAPQHEIGWRSVEKLHEDLVCLDERCREDAYHYYIHPLYDGKVSYTSKSAARLEPAAFLAMLAIAERHEGITR